MKKDEQSFRRSIFGQIKEYYKLYHKPKVFILGKSYIQYAGRVYNEKEIINLVDSALDFWLTSGKYCKQFEEKFADYLKVKYAMLTNSGSSANLLAIAALTSPLLKEQRLKPGDEIITTACGFPTTLNPIIQNSLVPVFADVTIGTYNIDCDTLERAISKKTKAIFVAHTLGNTANLDKIMQIVKKYKLWFVEDNCDAFGSEYKGKKTGTFGHISTYSFFPAHHITMGEGGAVATSDPVLMRAILSLRDWGKDCWCPPGQDNVCGRRFSQKIGSMPYGYDHKYIYSNIGYNLKITEMQAAVGVAQLKKLDGFIRKRRNNFDIFRKYFERHQNYFILPFAEKESNPSWFGFPIMVKRTAPFSRSEIVSYLEKNKIMTRMLFGGNLLKQPAYKDIKYRLIGSLKNTDYVMNNLFWIGVYPGLTHKQIRYIMSIFTKFINLTGC